MTTDRTSTSTDAALPGLFQTLWGFMGTQALYAGARLNVFDTLGDDILPARQLALRCHCDEASLTRLLRFLASLDIVHEAPDACFSLTPTGQYLRSDHPSSVRSLSLLYGQPSYWLPWGALDEAVKAGKPAFDHVHGMPFFDYLSSHPAEAAIFNAAMEDGSQIHLDEILGAYDFSALTKIVDIGGGSGAMLRGILRMHPHLEGVLYDLPAAFTGVPADARLSEPRLERIAGDMFEAVPSGADGYVLKRILHDWSDEEAIRILRNCRNVIPPQGRLLVVEAVLRPPNRPDPARWMDLNMMVLLTGKERSAAEFGRLLASAGFILTRVVTTTRMSILEAVPA
jgi:hypothetical protein